MAAVRHPDVIHEGWLTKSPPSKRFCKPKWRRRWFTLRQSKEMPAQFFLDYYTDKNGQKLKGSINLNLCEQIDAGLRMQLRDRKDTILKASVFSIRTKSRTYHLQADCETDMEKWVEVICNACGMHSTEDEKFFTRSEGTHSSSAPNSPRPYIPISECFTGPPSTYRESDIRVYINCDDALIGNKTFNLADSPREPVLTENDAPLSEELNHSLSITSQTNGNAAPPRPPKPTRFTRDSTFTKFSFVGAPMKEPKEEYIQKYYNLYAPVVDRNLKPRHSYTSCMSHNDLRCWLNRTHKFRLDIVHSASGPYRYSTDYPSKLQYLDLDLEPSNSESPSKSRIESSCSANYKEVDFLKTEALSMTRAEAYRRNDVQLQD
ncbi:daughter of sevenless [Arctopsyche grandis]|uniref:daughter of sevenless n=1 Tax=Arctopsyche grandis TaxID=121162 RepID=UPI00406D68EB